MIVKFLNIEIINICNLQCKMCDIWRNKNANFISDKEINDIFSSSYIPKDIDITITWGEPFLHPKIQEIFHQVHDLWYQINTISTNGMMLEKSQDLLKYLKQHKIPFPQFHISIDGLEEIHEKQRGINWCFKRSIGCISALRKQWIRVKIKYTITKTNIQDIYHCYKLAESLGVDIGFKIVENDENYTNRVGSPNLLSDKEKFLIYKILSKIYKTWDIYMENLLFYIKNDTLPFACKTPHTNMFIMANGNVYPCTKYKSIWNIREDSFNNICNNHIHKNIIQTVEKNKCSKCFSPHGAYKTVLL